jgi:hypothetical protein
MTQRARYGSQLVIGWLLILAGAALLLENQGILDIGPIWRFWPLILVAFGAAKVYRARSREEQGSGIWLLLLGLWLLVSIIHLWDLSFRDTWPAVFIVFGASMLWKSLPEMSSSDLAGEARHGQ